MFGATGAGLAAVKTLQNGGKAPRYSLDNWDRVRSLTLLTVCCRRLTSSLAAKYDVPRNSTTNYPESLLIRIRTVMERDRRLTGHLRGQTDNPIAPNGFEFSNGWKVCVPKAA